MPRTDTSFNQDIADEICELMSGGKSLTKICQDATMPRKPVVLKWLRENEAFATQYAHAREMLIDHYADDTIDIADTDPDPAKARVRVDARKWYASKLMPKKYGDRLTQELVGADGGAIQVEQVVTDEQRVKAMALLLTKGQAPAIAGPTGD